MDLANKEKCKELKEKIRNRNAENTKIVLSNFNQEQEIAILQVDQSGEIAPNTTDI